MLSVNQNNDNYLQNLNCNIISHYHYHTTWNTYIVLSNVNLIGKDQNKMFSHFVTLKVYKNANTVAKIDLVSDDVQGVVGVNFYWFINGW